MSKIEGGLPLRIAGRRYTFGLCLSLGLELLHRFAVLPQTCYSIRRARKQPRLVAPARSPDGPEPKAMTPARGGRQDTQRIGPAYVGALTGTTNQR